MSLFKVPEHIASVIFGGGCGVAHSGDSDCELCAPLAADHIYPAALDGPAAEIEAVAPPELAADPIPDAAPTKARKSQPTE